MERDESTGAGELQAYVAGEVQDVGYGAGCAAVLVEEGKSDKVFECHAVFGYGMGSFFGELRIAGRINMDIFAGGFLRIGEGIHVFQVYYRLARTFGLERLYEKRNRQAVIEQPYRFISLEQVCNAFLKGNHYLALCAVGLYYPADGQQCVFRRKRHGLLCYRSGLCVCCCFCCFSLCFCLGLSLCLCGSLFSFALADGFSSFLVYLCLGVEELAAGLVVSLLEILLLGLDLGVSLCLPCIPLLVCDFLAEGTLGNTAVEMLPQKDSLVREDTAAGVRG